jgi:hypothetical protein
MWACFCYWVAQVVATPTLGYGFIKESIGLLSSIESAWLLQQKDFLLKLLLPTTCDKARGQAKGGELSYPFFTS